MVSSPDRNFPAIEYGKSHGRLEITAHMGINRTLWYYGQIAQSTLRYRQDLDHCSWVPWFEFICGELLVTCFSHCETLASLLGGLAAPAI